jgi:TRAP transporter TAXI family solute receptor
VGDPAYVLGEGLAYYINQDSEWLKATALATPGLTADQQLAQKEPEKYIALAASTAWAPAAQLEQWNYYDQFRWIGLVMPYTYVWVTYDQDIKTMQDFAGKRVNIKRKGAEDTPGVEEILKRAGVWDKLGAVEYGGFGGNMNNLKDGLVDVAILFPDHVLPGSFRKGALIENVETKGPIYYISMPADVMEDMGAQPFSEATGFIKGTIFPGALGSTQPEAIIGAITPIFIGADERMPDDVVSEVTRIIWERAGQFGTWHPMGQNMTKELLATYMYSADLMHPGSVRFYEEEGVELRNLVEVIP